MRLFERQFGPPVPAPANSRGLSVGATVALVICAVIFAIGFPVLMCKVASSRAKRVPSNRSDISRQEVVERRIPRYAAPVRYITPDPTPWCPSPPTEQRTIFHISAPFPLAELPQPPGAQRPRRARPSRQAEEPTPLPNFMTLDLASDTSPRPTNIEPQTPSRIEMPLGSPIDPPAPLYETALREGAQAPPPSYDERP